MTLPELLRGSDRTHDARHVSLEQTADAQKITTPRASPATIVMTCQTRAAALP
jgi:hypothetical protein